MRHQPLCLDGTRVKILRDIHKWIEGDDPRPMFWLNGAAGTGKSTIARTVCRELVTQGRKVANYFFTRDDQTIADGRLLFSTMAKDLARQFGPGDCTFNTSLRKIIAGKPGLTRLSPRDQADFLLLQPLSQDLDCRIVLVIDALDEQTNAADIVQSLEATFQLCNISVSRLRILVTSRPEEPMRTKFAPQKALQRTLILHDVPMEDVSADIRLYFNHELVHLDERIKVGSTLLSRSAIIEILVRLASGLFVFASTLCHYLLDEASQSSPQERLVGYLEATYQNRQQPSDSAPMSTLDTLYTQILRNAIPTTSSQMSGQARVLDLLGLIANLHSPQCIHTIAKISGFVESSVLYHLGRLHSVIRVPADAMQPVRMIHPSFPEFLLSKSRSGMLWIDDQKAHRRLFDASIATLTQNLGLRVDTLENPAASLNDPEVASRIHFHIPSELAYACSHILWHRACLLIPIQDDDAIHKFIDDHLAVWLEVLACLGMIRSTLSDIRSIHLRTKVRHHILSQLLQ